MYEHNDFKKDVLRRFDEYVLALDLRPSLSQPARVFVEQDIDDFLTQELTSGLGKTRRPPFDEQYFDAQIERARELKRRENERLNRMFGE